MHWLFRPSKSPTPSEYSVIVWCLSAVFCTAGIVALVVGIRAPEEKKCLAVAVESIGIWSFGLGVAIAVGHWLYRRFVD